MVASTGDEMDRRHPHAAAMPPSTLDTPHMPPIWHGRTVGSLPGHFPFFLGRTSAAAALQPQELTGEPVVVWSVQPDQPVVLFTLRHAR